MRPTVSRRYFFLGVFAAAGCTARRVAGSARLVSVTRAESYDVDLEPVMRQILAEHGLGVRGQRVVLKPNLVEFEAQRPVNTHPRVVAAARAAFLAGGAREVLIAEGPGHRRATWELAESAGYFEAIPDFERVFTDLNLDEVTRVPIARPFSTLRELYLPRTVLGADLLVSMAKMKTHHWAGATLAMKNLFGLVPGGVYGWPKNGLHWAGIDESIADLNGLFPRHFSIVDGIDAMEGNGPILGTRKRMGVIVAGGHPASVDETCCRMMRIDPQRVGYLRLARGGDRERRPIAAIGSHPERLAQPFALIPELQHLRLGAGG